MNGRRAWNCSSSTSGSAPGSGSASGVRSWPESSPPTISSGLNFSPCLAIDFSCADAAFPRTDFWPFASAGRGIHGLPGFARPGWVDPPPARPVSRHRAWPRRRFSISLLPLVAVLVRRWLFSRPGKTGPRRPWPRLDRRGRLRGLLVHARSSRPPALVGRSARPGGRGPGRRGNLFWRPPGSPPPGPSMPFRVLSWVAPLRTRRVFDRIFSPALPVLQQARAFGPGLVLPLVPAALVLGGIGLLRVNNPLPAREAAAAARFGADRRGRGSPRRGRGHFREAPSRPGPWSRSLPLSSLRRAAADAFFLGVLALPAALATALLDSRSAAATAAALLYLAFRGPPERCVPRPIRRAVRSPVRRRRPDDRGALGAVALDGGLARPAAAFAARACRPPGALPQGRTLAGAALHRGRRSFLRKGLMIRFEKVSFAL